jgi:hypothetical protein
MIVEAVKTKTVECRTTFGTISLTAEGSITPSRAPVVAVESFWSAGLILRAVGPQNPNICLEPLLEATGNWSLEQEFVEKWKSAGHVTRLRRNSILHPLGGSAFSPNPPQSWELCGCRARNVNAENTGKLGKVWGRRSRHRVMHRTDTVFNLWHACHSFPPVNTESPAITCFSQQSDTNSDFFRLSHPQI